MILQGRVLILLKHKSRNTIKFNLIQFRIDIADLMRLDLGGGPTAMTSRARYGYGHKHPTHHLKRRSACNKAFKE